MVSAHLPCCPGPAICAALSDAELDYGSPGIITYHSSPAARISLGHFNTSRGSLMAVVPTATVHCPQRSCLSSGSLSVCLCSVSLLLLSLCYLCMFGGSHNTFSTYALITVLVSVSLVRSATMSCVHVDVSINNTGTITQPCVFILWTHSVLPQCSDSNGASSLNLLL